MADLFARVEFPGVERVIGFSFSFGHGVQPSVATLSIAPQSTYIPAGGTLRITWGSVRIEWPDCRIDRMGLARDESGLTSGTLFVMDRRWKWRHRGRLSGFYNVRLNSNEIRTETEKSPRELAKLCFKGMGEERFDVSAMPDDQRPSIEWDYKLPAAALADLCQKVGCRVVLGLDNRVRICPANEGERLPDGVDILDDELTFDPPERPDALIIVPGRTRWEHDFELEAVAEDLDGNIKRLADLSYLPTGGVAALIADAPHFLNVKAESDEEKARARKLAKKSVLKWFRIKTPIKLKGTADGEPIEELERILPIEEEQVAKYKLDGKERNRPAWVWGFFWNKGDKRDNSVARATDLDPEKVKDGHATLYERAFSIDKEKGIVKFSDHVYRLGTKEEDGAGEIGKVLEPMLRLRTAVNLREKDTRGWLRNELVRRNGGKSYNAGARYEIREDLCLNIKRDGSSNKPELLKFGEHYFKVLEREYAIRDPRSITYAGFKKIELDGAIAQLIFRLPENGKATTKANRNREDIQAATSYKDQILEEKLRELVKADDRPLAAKLQDQAKGRLP